MRTGLRFPSHHLLGDRRHRHCGRRRSDRVHWWVARVVVPVLLGLAASPYLWQFLTALVEYRRLR